MENKKFCHLHLHTEYSLLDSSAKVKKVFSRAKELGMESIAITDHGVMYGCVAFYKEAIAQGIKPILGCEVYVASKSMNIKINDKDNGTYHLVLLVKNEKGYENLMEIVSSASIDGFYYKPRVDLDILREYRGVKGVFHCYSGSAEMLSEVLHLGLYVAFGGSVTFKKSQRPVEAAKAAPLDKILIETDCPYLTPEPFRGKRNSSLYVHLVAEKLAEIKNMSIEEIENITLENAKKCFMIDWGGMKYAGYEYCIWISE